MTLIPSTMLLLATPPGKSSYDGNDDVPTSQPSPSNPLPDDDIMTTVLAALSDLKAEIGGVAIRLDNLQERTVQLEATFMPNGSQFTSQNIRGSPCQEKNMEGDS